MKKKKAESPAIQAQEIVQNGVHNEAPISDSQAAKAVNGQQSRAKDNNHDQVIEPSARVSEAESNDPSSVETKVEQAASQIECLRLQEAEVEYRVYENELQMPDIMRLIQKDLSEPYSIYTYRYFIHNWPHLCFMVRQLFGRRIVLKKSIKKYSLLSLRVALLLKPLVTSICPLKILSDYFRLFYTVNIQNLKESERIYKGQKRFTKGFF